MDCKSIVCFNFWKHFVVSKRTLISIWDEMFFIKFAKIRSKKEGSEKVLRSLHVL